MSTTIGITDDGGDTDRRSREAAVKMRSLLELAVMFELELFVRQGNLLKGIDNCLGAWYKGIGTLWTTSYSNIFFLFQLEKTNKKTFAVHILLPLKENIFWKKKCLKTAILSVCKLNLTEKRT